MVGGQGLPVKPGKAHGRLQSAPQESVFLGQLAFGNEDPFFLYQSEVMVPGRVLQIAQGEICLGVQLLFMIQLGGLMGGRTPPGGNPGRDDFTPEIAAFELVGAP
jgi:hypothetical protein